MNRLRSQISVALVCILLGFLITYQFKLLNKSDNPANMKDGGNTSEIIAEIDKTKNDINDIEKKNTSLIAEIKKYEDMATGSDQSTKTVRDQLDQVRALLGLSDVQGAGVTITLVPKSSLFSKNSLNYFLADTELLIICNELNVRGAEAISINDKRITSQSGIKSSSNNSYILINDDKISPRDKIEIKVIGPKSKFKGIQDFIKGVHLNMLNGYEIKVDESDAIKIPRYSRSYVSRYIVPAK